MVQLGFLSQSGFANPNTLTPTVKKERKRMTKRNLLLVSFLLVFGLLAMATSALAQTQWTQGVSLANGDMRNEGLAESTGIVSVDNYTTGNVSGGSYFILTYSSNGSPVPIVPGSWSLSCAGTAGPFVGGS